MRTYRKHLLLHLIVGVIAVWQSASASEFECRNGAQLRRVEVRSGPAVEDVACEVRYWRDATRQGSGEVLWRANQDANFCEDKAAVLIGRLEAGGWRCTAVDQPAPSAPVREADTAAPAESAPQPVPVPPAAQAPSPIEPTAGPADQAALTTPSEPPLGPAAAAARPAILHQVVAETLRNVQQMYGGEFRAEGTAFGDLNGDGREDAAVLVTYQADRDDYVQYLVAYLFDGETYRSTDTENVGGRFLEALRAEIRDIVDQTIIVDLQSLDANQDCCDTRRAAFALRNGELVEVEVAAGVNERRSNRSTPSEG
jgi:hypothetical protein